MTVVADEQSQLAMERARAAYATFAVQAYEDVRARLGSLNQLAILGLQSLILINGGAVVALFSLLAQGAATPFVAKVYPLTLWWAFGSYGIGISAAMAALLLGYVSQLQLNVAEQVTANDAKAYTLNHLRPSAEEFEAANRQISLGNNLLNTAIAAATLSLVAFVVGGGMALWATLGAIGRA